MDSIHQDRRRSMSDILATDLIKALWEDARREADPDRKAQLERDAAALEDVWQRSPYALAATRDQMTAALGNASLNIADTLSALASGQRQVDARVGEIHTAVQENNTLFSTFFETFAPFQEEARAAWEESGRQVKKLSGEVGSLTARTATIETILAARPAQRAAEHQAIVDELHARALEKITALQQVTDAHAARLDTFEDIRVWRASVDEQLAAILQADRDDIRTEIKDIRAALARYEAKHQELIARLEERRAAAAERGGDGVAEADHR